jgi:hypothetical protein
MGATGEPSKHSALLAINDDENEEDEESFHSATDDEDDDDKSLTKSTEPKLSQSVQRITETNDEIVIEASYMKYQIYLKQIQILFINNLSDLKKINEIINGSIENKQKTSDFNEKCFILTPLDLFFNIHQCIYTDDLRMPALKVFGNLPIIDFTLTTLKLEQIIKLITSIPFPRPYSAEYGKSQNISIYSEYFDEFSENGNNNDMDEQQENVKSSSKLMESLKSIVKLKKKDKSTKEDKKSIKSEYLTADNLHQAINFEFGFVINEIIFKMKEEIPKNFDWILFKISSFGATLQAKTYDTYLNIYLNKIICEYGLLNDVDGKKLYMISSNPQNPQAENYSLKQNLIDIKLTQTDSQSPTLKLLHDNVLTNVVIELRSLDFVINLIAIKNILNFVDTFQKNLKSLEYLQYQTELDALNQAKLVSAKKYFTGHRGKDPLLNDDQIKYLIKKANDPKTSEIKAKLQEILGENDDSIELKLKANMDGIRARLCTSKQNYFKVNIENFEVNVTNKSNEQNLDFVLNSISVQDLESNVKYENIVSLAENSNNLINVQLTMINVPKVSLSSSSILAAQYQKEKFYFKNYLNENHFDLIINANISKLRFMFLYKHLNTIMVKLNFFTKLEAVTKRRNSGPELRNFRRNFIFKLQNIPPRNFLSKTKKCI